MRIKEWVVGLAIGALIGTLILLGARSCHGFTTGDLKDQGFRKHIALGVLTFEIGYRGMGLVLDRVIETHWTDREGNVHFEYMIAHNPDDMAKKGFAGIAVSILVTYLTAQDEKDAEAIRLGVLSALTTEIVGQYLQLWIKGR